MKTSSMMKMKTKTLTAMVLAMAMASCSGDKTAQPTEGLQRIDVAKAMVNITELKTSDIGSRIRIVPLETNDSCLVGNKPAITLTDKHILVTSGKECLCFDKNTGQFIASIGHPGDDPQAYDSNTPAYNEANELIYFTRQPDKLQIYTTQGHFRTTISLPTPPAMPTEFTFSGDTIIGHYTSLAQSGESGRSLLLTDGQGLLIDSIPSVLPTLEQKTVGDIESFSIFTTENAGFVLTTFNDHTRSISVTGVKGVWKTGEKVRYKECFNDTVYTINGNKLTPTYYLDYGDKQWPCGNRTLTEGNSDLMLTTNVLETENVLLFQCIQDIFGNKKIHYGLYDKASATVRMAPDQAGLTDDLGGFLPFKPTACSLQGEYAAIADVSKVLPWMDEHPDAAKQPALAPLATLNEDSNPVVIIVAP